MDTEANASAARRTISRLLGKWLHHPLPSAAKVLATCFSGNDTIHKAVARASTFLEGFFVRVEAAGSGVELTGTVAVPESITSAAQLHKFVCEKLGAEPWECNLFVGHGGPEVRSVRMGWSNESEVPASPRDDDNDDAPPDLKQDTRSEQAVLHRKLLEVQLGRLHSAPMTGFDPSIAPVLNAALTSGEPVVLSLTNESYDEHWRMQTKAPKLGAVFGNQGFSGLRSNECATVSPNGQFALVGSGHVSSLCSLRDGTLVRPLYTTGWTDIQMRFLPDSRYFVIGSKHQIHLCDVLDVDRDREIPGLRRLSAMRALAVSSNGRYVARTFCDSSGETGPRVWDLQKWGSFTQYRHPTGEHPSSICFSPDDQYLAGGSTNNGNVSVVLWNVETNVVEKRFELVASSSPGNDDSAGKNDFLHSPLTCLSFSRDGQLLFAAVRDHLLVWRVHDGKLLRDMIWARGTIRAFDVTPDGRYAAVASNVGCEVIQLKPGRAAVSVRSFLEADVVVDVAFASREQFLVVAARKTAHMFDLGDLEAQSSSLP
eukprot:INCI11898.1.p1 GENE.INCI11898.1~~INCI11898.1.p1  ORF type:complete len:541 (+),score=79.66 INCI11898.1:542-2164(+)